MSESESTASLTTARRIVVKIGSSSLTSVEGGISDAALNSFVAVLAERKRAGTEIVLVTSGAIAAGLAPLGLARRPKDLATQQSAASVGQGLLMAKYTHAFAKYGITVSQVLLTAEDLTRRTQYANAYRAVERLLNLGVVPIVNENDAVATHEIRFGDNDRLSALVAHLTHADGLLLLSDVDAVYTAPPQQGGIRIPHVNTSADLETVTIGQPTGSGIGTGGMGTKIQAALTASNFGTPALVTSAANAGRALAGEPVGTWFSVSGTRRPIRLLWLAHLATVQGSLTLDDGAVRAVRDKHRSVLAAGVTGLSGSFEAGDAISLVDVNSRQIAKGLVGYSSEELKPMLGQRSSQLRESLGPEYARSVVHVDDLVVLSY